MKYKQSNFYMKCPKILPLLNVQKFFNFIIIILFRFKLFNLT